jgi:hypothetical protein
MQVVITPMDDTQLQDLPEATELAAQLMDEVGVGYAAQVADAITRLMDERYAGNEEDDDTGEDPQSDELPMNATPQQRGYNSGEIGLSRFMRIKRR